MPPKDRRYHPSSRLLYSNLSANLGHLLSNLVGLILRDGLFDSLRGIIDHSFSLFQAQAGQFADNLNDIDLVRTNLGKDGIKLGLLFDDWCGFSSGGDRSSSGGGDRSSAYAPLFLQGLGQLNELEYVQFFDFSNDGIKSHDVYLLIIGAGTSLTDKPSLVIRAGTSPALTLFLFCGSFTV